MKNIFRILFISTVVACDQDINVNLPDTDPLVAFDAWLSHKADQQTIDIYITNTYFDSSNPAGISGASVQVFNVNDPTERYTFLEQSSGSYVWNPASPSDTFAIIGETYSLNVNISGTAYESITTLGEVPPIDSLTWRFDDGDAFTEGIYYFANFWARDIEGAGNTYWIKSWKNGELLNKPSEINIAYDAAFSVDGNADGFIFIQPIREQINPFEFNDNDELISPFHLPDSVIGGVETTLEHRGITVTYPNDTLLVDSIYVELSSISNEAFYFLQQVQIQTSREGGFGELFAVPLANVQSNVFSSDPNEKVVGFFNISAISSLGKVFTEDDIIFPE
jgi:hypothetical protein